MVMQWQIKYLVKQLVFEDKRARKLMTDFCSVYNIHPSTFVEILKKIGIEIPNLVLKLEENCWMVLETGEKVKLNLELNPDDFSHITVEKEGIKRGYNLDGFKNKIEIFNLRGRHSLKCAFDMVRGYNIKLDDAIYLTVEELEENRIKGLKKELLDEISSISRRVG